MRTTATPGVSDSHPSRRADGEVLFATIAAGGGHVATARAMAEAVEESSAGRLHARVSDAMAEYGAAELDRRHKRAWRQMLARPTLVRIGQHLTDAVPAVTRTLHNALLDGFAESVAKTLNEDPPKLVVANHGWLATAFTRARTRFGLLSPVIVFATEPFDASALWSTPRAESVLAPSAAARSDLIELGVPADNVHVAGYPVARRFTQAPSKSDARTALNLRESFTCLLSLGAEGVTGGGQGVKSGDDAIAAVLELLAGGVDVIAICGRNEELKARLLEAAGRQAVRRGGAGADPARGQLHVHGFAENMELLLAAADVVAGKAGPASTMEALAVGRPVLAAAYAGLNERAVIRFLQTFGLGAYSGGFAGLPAMVQAWRDPQRLRLAGAAAAALGFAAATAGIGRFLSAAADRQPDDASALLAPGAFTQVTRERLNSGGLSTFAGSVVTGAGARPTLSEREANRSAGNGAS